MVHHPHVSMKPNDIATCNICLGRDTIANGAAKVAPAVVNIVVPLGIHFEMFFDLNI